MFLYESKYKFFKDLFVCLRMQVCKHVCVQLSDADRSGIALLCTLYWEREGPTETHIVSEASALISNYSQNRRAEEKNYIGAEKVGNSVCTANLETSSVNILWIIQQQQWLNTPENKWAPHLDFQGHHTTHVSQAVLLKTARILFS